MAAKPSAALKTYQGRGGCQIVALADPNRLNLARYAGAFNVKKDHCYQDFRELLDLDGLALKHPGIDIVSICTPQHVHCQNVLAVACESKSV